MRLYYDIDSDNLYWAKFDAFADDVTDRADFQDAAAKRGLTCPGVVPEVISEHTFAKAITQSYKKWERKPSDLYPTPVDGTESLIPVLKELGVKRIWEPACGDGRLARVLEWHGFEVVATDLREYPGYGVGGLDFLNENPLEKWGWDIGEIDMIVTNPPFSLAEEFIRKALSITPKAAMLLKQTYWNVGGRSTGLWLDHMPDLELKLTWRLAFLAKERGNSPLMDCMWNVWTGENAASDEKACAAEPLPRRKYPGYGGIGVKSAMQVLEGELDELTSALRGFVL